MAEKSRLQTADLFQYVLAHGHNDQPLLRELEEETLELGRIAGMQISREQGTLMSILVRAIGAKSAIEIGTFTGYSSICVARALPTDGHLLCCDVSEEWTALARKYWRKAGLADKITLKIGPALDTLHALPGSAAFDFAFIDADKSNYVNYYEEILRRMRRGGLILVDNVMWRGKVLDQDDQSEDTAGIRRINELIARDDRVDAVMLSIADGVTIACKK